MVENRHPLSSSTSLPRPVIPSGFIHVKRKDMNEKPCEAERRRGKGGERISCCQGNRHHGNYLINELVMNPSNMVLVKSCCSNYQSFIHAGLAGAAQAARRSLRALTDGSKEPAESMAGERVPGSVLQCCSEPAPRPLEHGDHMPSNPSYSPSLPKGSPAGLVPPTQAAFTSSLQSKHSAQLLPLLCLQPPEDDTENKQISW